MPFCPTLDNFLGLELLFSTGSPRISLRKRVQPRDPQPQLDGSIIINAPSLMCQMGWQWRQTNNGGRVGGRAVRRAHKDWDRDRPKPISAEIFCRISNRIFCWNRIVSNWHYEVGTILHKIFCNWQNIWHSTEYSFSADSENLGFGRSLCSWIILRQTGLGCLRLLRCSIIRLFEHMCSVGGHETSDGWNEQPTPAPFRLLKEWLYFCGMEHWSTL